jgi:hypothetical protein
LLLAGLVGVLHGNGANVAAGALVVSFRIYTAYPANKLSRVTATVSD